MICEGRMRDVAVTRRALFSAAAGVSLLATAAASGTGRYGRNAESGMEINETRTALVDADPDRGFQYPYYRFVPETVPDEEVSLLVEPVNTGNPSDNFDEHLAAAEETASAHHSETRKIAIELGCSEGTASHLLRNGEAAVIKRLIRRYRVASPLE